MKNILLAKEHHENVTTYQNVAMKELIENGLELLGVGFICTFWASSIWCDWWVGVISWECDEVCCDDRSEGG